MQDTNILEAHYSKNCHPQPPSPARLQDLQQHMVQNPTDDNNDRSDDLAPLSRQKRYSKNSKLEHCTDPTQLGFYPPKWMDFLEECKVETHTYAMVHEPWLHSKLAIDGFISNAVTMTIQKWRHTQKTVEKGYYPKYKKEMCKLVRAPTQSTLLR